MEKKIARGVVIFSIILTTLSFVFLVGLFIYNIRRMSAINNVGAFGVVVACILVLASLTLIVYIVILSFFSFFSDKEIDWTQYMNILIIAIVFRLILYVIFGLNDVTQTTGFFGFLNDVHYSSYVLAYRTDILPVSVFPGGTLAFTHSLMSTDIFGVGFVIVGIVLAKKDKFAPIIGAGLGIITSLIFALSINSIIVNTYGSTLVYYKLDAIMTTLIVEFAMLGYVVRQTFQVKLRRKSK